MPKITRIDAFHVRVPLRTPIAFSTRNVAARDYVLVEVHGDNGARGIGFCYAGNTGGSVVLAAVNDLVAPNTVGKDSYLVQRIWQENYQQSILHGRTGSAMRALSIIDVAIWDLNARSAGLPLHHFLGGYHADKVPAYASGGYYWPDESPKRVAAEMKRYADLGFKAVKMKVGRLTPKEEEARIAAAREAIGDDAVLMLDANNAWHDMETALRFMRVYEPYRPYWIEEPFSPDQIRLHGQLAAKTPVPVATGEIEAGRWRFLDILEQDAACILQTDAAVCGGISEFLRIAATADAFGKTLCPHWFHDLHDPLVAALANGRYVEYFADDTVLNFRVLVEDQLETDGEGNLVLHQAPGLGFEFNAAEVTRYLVDKGTT